MSSSSIYSNTISQDVEEEESMSLSELVRTGETSRLRRRGAITGAHRARQSTSSFVGSSGEPPYGAGFGQYTPNRQIPQVPQAAIAPPPPWADPGSVPQLQPQPSWTDVSDPTKADDDADGAAAGYALYCGVEEWEFGDEQPYEVSPLPMSFDDDEDESGSMPSYTPQRLRKSTGCGALVHIGGSPRPRSWTWQARGRASATVIPLDKAYFERGGQPKLFSCGCRWHGVGCSNCGNALGNIYMPCAASISTTSRGQQQRVPPNPSTHSIYTFFADSVTASPSYEFPPCPTGPAYGFRAPMVPTMEGAGGEQTWESGASEYTYGYNYAEQEEQEQEQEEPGAVYDRNGVLIANEPGSPDKPSSDILWPAR